MVVSSVELLKADMLVDTLKADTKVAVWLTVFQSLVDLMVDSKAAAFKAADLTAVFKAADLTAALTVADTVKVAGDLVLVNMAVSKITGTQVNRLLDTINHFKAKVSHTRWDLGADTEVVMVEDTAVELDSVQ